MAVTRSPKPPPQRVSMTLSTINNAREVWVVAAGAEKAGAVADSLRGDAGLPAGAVRGTNRTLWLIDAAASTAA
jgi:6-phosphogluconolactonase